MGTRSTIAILKKNGTVKSIYGQSDGYIAGIGVTLYEHYQNSKKIKELIDLGAILSLGEDVAPPSGVEHNFDTPHKGVTKSFFRDGGRDEPWVTNFSSFENYLINGVNEEYNYIFDEKINKWYLLNDTSNKLDNLEDIIMNDDDVKDITKKRIESSRLFAKINQELPKKINSEHKKKI